MAKRLVLITSGFPYGKGETFLENEITYLAKAFEEICILCPEPTDSSLRTLPKNCPIAFYSKELTKIDKIKALKGLFTKETFEELKIIRDVYQLRKSKGIISTLLISLHQANKLVEICQENYLDGWQRNIETVFYSYWCDDSAIALAILKKRHPNIKCISRMHRWDIYFEESKVNYLPFRTFTSETLNKIVSISQDGIDYAINKWKVDLRNFSLSRLGVKKTGFVEPVNEIVKIVSCSNVIPVKRVSLISETLKKIYDIKIEWTHFGDGIFFNDLKQNIKEIPKNITVILPGRVPNQEVLKEYKAIRPHLFINVSLSEGVPVSIMEAMSFGIPCIATDVGGNREIVNNENGVLLKANPSIKDIETAIRSCLKDDSKRKLAYKTWENEYNAEKNYEAFVKMLLK